MNITQATPVTTINQARAAGYSDDEIADVLAESDSRVGKARQNGCTGAEFLGHLDQPSASPAMPAERETLGYEQKPQPVISQRDGKRKEVRPCAADQDPSDATSTDLKFDVLVIHSVLSTLQLVQISAVGF